MQELINKLMSEAGLNADQAQKTIQTVISFVKSKVPPAMSGSIENLFQGIEPEIKEQSYKEKAEDFAEATKDKLEDLADKAKEKISEMADKAEDITKDAVEKIKSMFDQDKK